MSPLFRPWRYAVLGSCILVLTGCFGRSSNTSQTGSGALIGSIADDAVGLTLQLVGGSLEPRPAALMGMYSTMYLSGQGFLAANSALQGVMAESIAHAKPSQDQIDTTYALLEEYGTVLAVNIPDLLNRSDNRSQTLNDYMEGLKNITARSQQKTMELEQQISSLQDEERTKRRTVSDLQRDQKAAITSQDFVRAGEVQQELSTAQSDLAKTESDRKLQTSVHSTFEDLLEVAQKRIASVESNREILVAGLKVVDVPGVEDLGILDSANARRRRSGLGL